MLELAQLMTIFYGIVCVALPAFYGVYFYSKGGSRLGLVLAAMLWGEANSAAAAVYFATNSYMHVYNSMPPEVAMGIRIYIFTVPLITTMFLVAYFKGLMVPEPTVAEDSDE